MKFDMSKIVLALVTTTLATAAQSAVVGPTNMQITGGTLDMGYFTYGAQPFSLFGGNDITDQYNPAGWDTQVAQASGVLAPGAVMSVQFGTGVTDQMNFFLAPTALGAFGGGAAPVFNGSLVDGNVSSIDMRALFWNWNGSSINGGNAAQPSNGNNPLVSNLTMSGCVTGQSCNWTMSWSTGFVGGAFNGLKGTYALSGTITAVPEASTFGMMLAGLSSVVIATRRRKMSRDM